MSHYSINDREIWQEMRAIKKLAERNVKSNNKKSPTPNRSGKSKSNSHKRLKDERQIVQACPQTMVNNEQQIDF